MSYETTAPNGITFHHHSVAGSAMVGKETFHGDMHMRRAGESVHVYSRPNGEWHAATKAQCKASPPSRRTDLLAIGTRDDVVDAVTAYLLAL